MQIAIVAILALAVGVVMGFLMRAVRAKSEQAQAETLTAERGRQLAEARQELERTRTEAAARASFESLAGERERRIGQLAAEIEGLRGQLAARSEEAAGLASSVAKLEAQLESEQKNLDEKLALLETAKKTLSDQFQLVAGEILEQKTRTFSLGSQKELGNLLNPLKTQIEEFRKKVEEAQSDSKIGVTELKTLIGTLGNLNQALTEEAHNLATALRRDTKMQGNWGETILRNILEKSGLQKGLHYSFQESFVELNAEGESMQRRQTDVVVKVPGGHHLIIDSKVSLNAYNDSVNASTEKEREEALKRHLASVRNHYNELSARNYQSLAGMESPDFVVMFLPIEPAFLLALQGDDDLWHDAYKKKVLLCGPTTVLFVIRIVVDLWRQEKQARNVNDVMKRGSLLYEKFVGFISDMEKIGKSLQSAKDAHSEAMDKLAKADGNLVGQAEKLKKLGIRTTKSLPRNLLETASAEEGELALTDSDETGGAAEQ